jgi:isohexenylglutaconyl-CoA hydratase
MSSPTGPETLGLRVERGALHVLLNRPEVRNAMSFRMVEELTAVFEEVEQDREIRAVVLRGAGAHFCAGGDIKDMSRLRNEEPAPGGSDPIALGNRRFGALLSLVDRSPKAVIALLEGTVMGGGFGLACVSDVTIAHEGTVFRLPETGLGIPPAQITPFIVRRIGLTQARRLAVTGGRIDASSARDMGLVHRVVGDESGLRVACEEVLDQVSRCAPGAIATTKALMMETAGEHPIDRTLDRGAELFAEAVRSPEGAEGMIAFIQKRAPSWDTRHAGPASQEAGTDSSEDSSKDPVGH